MCVVVCLRVSVRTHTVCMVVLCACSCLPSSTAAWLKLIGELHMETLSAFGKAGRAARRARHAVASVAAHKVEHHGDKKDATAHPQRTERYKRRMQ